MPKTVPEAGAVPTPPCAAPEPGAEEGMSFGIPRRSLTKEVHKSDSSVQGEVGRMLEAVSPTQTSPRGPPVPLSLSLFLPPARPSH